MVEEEEAAVGEATAVGLEAGSSQATCPWASGGEERGSQTHRLGGIEAGEEAGGSGSSIFTSLLYRYM